MKKRYKLIEIPKFCCKNQEVHTTEYHDGVVDYVFICKLNKKVCNIKDCKNVKLDGHTKEEMVDKMARAIYFEIEKETKTIKSKYTFSSKKFAEAALKALLEDK